MDTSRCCTRKYLKDIEKKLLNETNIFPTGSSKTQPTIDKYNKDIKNQQSKKATNTKSNLEIGDKVCLDINATIKTDKDRKCFGEKYIGPYTVCKRTSPVTYLIDNKLKTEKTSNFHIRHLKKITTGKYLSVRSICQFFTTL
jgi:ribosomal protein L21E